MQAQSSRVATVSVAIAMVGWNYMREGKSGKVKREGDRAVLVQIVAE